MYDVVRSLDQFNRKIRVVEPEELGVDPTELTEAINEQRGQR